MNDLIRKIMGIKENIEDAKERQARYEGKRATLMEQLDRDFECETIEEGEDLLKDIDNRCDKLEEEIGRELESFKKKYEL